MNFENILERIENLISHFSLAIGYFECSSVHFSFVTIGEKGAPATLFGQSFASVWSEYEKEAESDFLGAVGSVSISL